MSIITLLTDFGIRDYFVASMKGVILSINSSVKIVDITHEVPKYNIAKAAFILYSCYKYFPKNTIHVVVVDPGVGTERRPIIIKSKNYYFVGPDNGVLTLAAEDDGIEKVYEISVGRYTRSEISSTFHGRDIFAPIAAYLSLGINVDELGREINNYVKLPIVRPRIINNIVECCIVYIDSFGNAYTSLKYDDLKKLNFKPYRELEITLKDNVELRIPFVKAYNDVSENSPLALINSEGYLELAVNKGNFAEMFNVKEFDKVLIKLK